MQLRLEVPLDPTFPQSGKFIRRILIEYLLNMPGTVLGFVGTLMDKAVMLLSGVFITCLCSQNHCWTWEQGCGLGRGSPLHCGGDQEPGSSLCCVHVPLALCCISLQEQHQVADGSGKGSGPTRLSRALLSERNERGQLGQWPGDSLGNDPAFKELEWGDHSNERGQALDVGLCPEGDNKSRI